MCLFGDGEGNKEIPPLLVNTFFGKSLDTAINTKNDLHKFNVGIQGYVGISVDIGSGKKFIERGGNYGFMYSRKGEDHGKKNIGAGTVLIRYTYNIRTRKPI